MPMRLGESTGSPWKDHVPGRGAHTPAVRLLAITLVAAAVGPATTAALVPTFDRRSAAPGDMVAVSFVGNPRVSGPFRLDLVRTRDEPRIAGPDDPRLTLVASFPEGRVIPSRIRFVLPRLSVGGAYTVAAWLRVPDGNWFNVAQGLWRDPSIGPRITLRVTAAPVFRASTSVVPASLRAHMPSWHPGCPVGVRDLRLLTLAHWSFDGRVREGRLVVHRDAVAAITRVFRTLFALQFPIRRIEPVDRYGANDDRSMAADNTSVFNCRPVEGTSRWSEHAYGRAIDINPVENPFVSGTHVSPPRGRAYADRARRAPGMIHAGDAVVRAFAAVGWRWGGNWNSPKDYQHFSASGR